MKKTYSENKTTCEVTFELPPEVQAQTAQICGEFNGWDQEANPMERQDDGSFTLTLELSSGRSYQFRYLLDETHWENDWAADTYVPNLFGGEDSVVEV